MERFHIIEDAAVILRSKGVFKQAKVYRRGQFLYAGHGAGFIQLYENRGTSHPDVSVVDVDIPGEATAKDKFGRLTSVRAS